MPGELDAAPEAAEDSDELVLYGNSFVDRVTYVSGTFSSLIMCMGKTARAGDDVLVPLVEMTLQGPVGPDESASKTLFSEMMPFENVAFILKDVSGDLITVCRQLNASSSGRMKPDAKRLAETKRLLVEAKGNLEKCLADIEGIG